MTTDNFLAQPVSSGPNLSWRTQLRELTSWRQRLSFLFGRHTPHWCRVVMDHQTRSFMSELGPQSMKVLEVSGTGWSRFGFGSYQSVAYPDYDLCAGPLKDIEPFDLVIAEQVLEHVLDPRAAVRNAYRMLRPGGWLLVTTPFMVRLHPQPWDVHRWTETGMRCLLEGEGFETGNVQTHSWGNRKAVVANLDRWVRYKPLRHSLVNEERYPLVVWAFAQKLNSGEGETV